MQVSGFLLSERNIFLITSYFIEYLQFSEHIGGKDIFNRRQLVIETLWVQPHIISNAGLQNPKSYINKHKYYYKEQFQELSVSFTSIPGKKAGRLLPSMILSTIEERCYDLANISFVVYYHITFLMFSDSSVSTFPSSPHSFTKKHSGSHA